MTKIYGIKKEKISHENNVNSNKIMNSFGKLSKNSDFRIKWLTGVTTKLETTYLLQTKITG